MQSVYLDEHDLVVGLDLMERSLSCLELYSLQGYGQLVLQKTHTHTERERERDIVKLREYYYMYNSVIQRLN